LYVPAEEIDEAGDIDTPLLPHNVWSTPRNSGQKYCQQQYYQQKNYEQKHYQQKYDHQK
jgi:hypothetical protein